MDKFTDKLTPREISAIQRFGEEKCIEAYKANDDGEGANNIALDILDVSGGDSRWATMWGDRAIDAGRKLFWLR